MNNYAQIAVRFQKMACYALFSDRSAHKIHLDRYEKEDGERISSRSMVRNAAVRASAECGFSAALNQFENRLEQTGKNYDIVWDLDGNVFEANNYDGLSAGLAFFTAFLVQLTGSYCMRNPGRHRNGPPFSVAATGILSGVTSKARVEKVAHFEDKLSAALAVLNQGDKLLYPHANQEEIHPKIEAAFGAAGIELVPVATPGEAAAAIFSWFIDFKDRPCVRKLRRMLACLLRIAGSRSAKAAIMLIGLLALYYIICRPAICTPEKLLDALEYGEFEKIKICLNRESDDPLLRTLLRQMRTPLSLTSSFIYLEGDRTLLQDTDALNVMQNVVIDSSMGYRFEVQVYDTCFFYLFQFSDDAAMDLLFPVSDFELENHLLSNNQLFMIPGGINYFYLTGASPRHLVTLCFLGSFWRARDIEELHNKYLQEQQPRRLREIRGQILQRIQKRRRALDSGLQGLYYHQGFFWRQ